MLAKLEKFKAAISTKPVESNSKGEDLSDWTGVKLKFAPEPGKVCFIFLFAFQYHVLYVMFRFWICGGKELESEKMGNKI